VLTITKTYTSWLATRSCCLQRVSYLTSSLVGAGRADGWQALRLDYRWLEAKLTATDAVSLLVN
jgi:hypothetical protein